MENKSGLPSEVSIWSKIRSFLFKEIEITDVELSLTPKQEKVFQEVHDFLCIKYWNIVIFDIKLGCLGNTKHINVLKA